MCRPNGVDFNPKILKERFDINYVTRQQQQATGEYGAVTRIDNNFYIINIPTEALEGFRQLPNIVTVTQINGKQSMDDYPADTPPMLMRLYQQYNTFGPNQDIFPNPKNGDKLVYNWSRDNYGPLYMPKAGDKIALNEDTYLKYSRAITAYENNTLERKGDQFILNGEVATEYTFKQGYYWMMGDNRHASDDSRYWGFVPEDHIVGKPVFIWMSYDKFADGIKKIRFDRVFTTVNGEGKRFSYFFPFLIVVLGIYGFNKYRKRKKGQA